MQMIMQTVAPTPTEGKGGTAERIDLVFILIRPATDKNPETLPPGQLKLFVHAGDLPEIFGSSKVAEILKKHCLTPVIKSASRLTLYWLGDVLSVADRLRRREIAVDLTTGTVTQNPPNKEA